MAYTANNEPIKESSKIEFMAVWPDGPPPNKRMKPLQPLGFHGGRDVVFETKGRRAGSRAVYETERAVVFHGLKKLHRGFKIRVRFTRKAHDEIRAEAQLGAAFAEVAQALQIFLHGVFPQHSPQHYI